MILAVQATARRRDITLTEAMRSQGQRALGRGLEILGETAVAVQPCKRAFDHPARRKVENATSFAGPGRCQS